MEAMSDIVWTINSRNDRFENIINRMRASAAELFEAKGYDCIYFNAEFDKIISNAGQEEHLSDI